MSRSLSVSAAKFATIVVLIASSPFLAMHSFVGTQFPNLTASMLFLLILGLPGIQVGLAVARPDRTYNIPFVMAANGVFYFLVFLLVASLFQRIRRKGTKA